MSCLLRSRCVRVWFIVWIAATSSVIHSHAASTMDSSRLATTFPTLPLMFESVGAAGTEAVFRSRGCNHEFTVRPRESDIFLSRVERKKKAATSLNEGFRGLDTERITTGRARLRFINSHPDARLAGEQEVAGKFNYLLGNNPLLWRSGLAAFRSLRVEQLYKGIDLLYYGNQRQLEYDFQVQPGANPDLIAIEFQGAD